MKFLLVPALLITATLFASAACCVAKSKNLATTALTIGLALACLALAVVIVLAR